MRVLRTEVEATVLDPCDLANVPDKTVFVSILRTYVTGEGVDKVSVTLSLVYDLEYQETNFTVVVNRDGQDIGKLIIYNTYQHYDGPDLSTAVDSFNEQVRSV